MLIICKISLIHNKLVPKFVKKIIVKAILSILVFTIRNKKK